MNIEYKSINLYIIIIKIEINIYLFDKYSIIISNYKLYIFRIIIIYNLYLYLYNFITHY